MRGAVPIRGPRCEVLGWGFIAPSREMLPTPRIRCQGLGRLQGQSQLSCSLPPSPSPSVRDWRVALNTTGILPRRTAPDTGRPRQPLALASENTMSKNVRPTLSHGTEVVLPSPSAQFWGTLSLQADRLPQVRACPLPVLPAEPSPRAPVLGPPEGKWLLSTCRLFSASLCCSSASTLDKILRKSLLFTCFNFLPSPAAAYNGHQLRDLLRAVLFFFSWQTPFIGAVCPMGFHWHMSSERMVAWSS